MSSLGVGAEAFCREYAPRVARFAALAARNAGDADDIAQESLLKALRALDRFDARKGTLDAWLWTIVRNTARDHDRRARRFAFLIDRVSRESQTDQDPTQTRELDEAELRVAVSQLPERDRTLLALRFGAELSIREIASITNLEAETARKAIARALHRLRGQMGVEDER